MIELKRIKYEDLKGQTRKQENYNFHKAAAILVDYGFTTISRLSDDRNEVDFTALHMDGKTEIKIQLTGGIGFYKAYLGKDIYIMFCDQPTGVFYIYNHDELIEEIKSQVNYFETDSWKGEKEKYTISEMSDKLREMMQNYAFKEDRNN
jgi:hypothetical protein